MTARLLHTSAMLGALLILLSSESVWAQEVIEEVPEGVPEEADRSRLLYIDAPMPIQSELDTVLLELPPAVNPEEDPDYGLRSESIRQYSSTVADIEASGGVWDRSLAEELMSLGSLQQQQGNHPEAVETFDRAIHINRINAGLHTLEQIPAIEQLIQSHLVMGNWEEADIYNNYLFYVQQKAFGRNDPRLIPVLDKLATWNIQAFNIGYGELLGVRLREAQILFVAAARMVGAHFGSGDERRVEYLRNIANSSYLLSRNEDLLMELNQPEFRTSQSLLMSKLNEVGTWVLPPGFQAGERALQEISDFYREKDDAPYKLAEAITNVADWHLIFGRRKQAYEHYLEAWQVLQGQENSEEQIDRLFGQVVPLPTFAESVNNPASVYQTNSESDALNHDFADVTFDVNSNGLVRNVRVVSEETLSNSRHHNRLRSSIRDSYFRPVIVDGKPQRSNGNHFRYRYWY